MPGPETGLNRACRKVGAVAEVLPQSWSGKARGEINEACGKIAAKAKTKARDLEHLAAGQLGRISEETWTELAEIARDQAKSLSAGPAKDPYPKLSLKPAKLTDLTKGKGERFKLGVPVKLSSGTDIYLFLNYDKKRLLRGDPTLYGGGAGFKQAVGNRTSLSGEVLLDTSKEQTSKAGFIKLEVAW